VWVRAAPCAICAAPNCACASVSGAWAGLHGRLLKIGGQILDGGVPSHMGGWFPRARGRGPVARCRSQSTSRRARSVWRAQPVNYLRSVRAAAVCHYAEACLSAGVALVNCVPVFVASNPSLGERFRAAAYRW